MNEIPLTEKTHAHGGCGCGEKNATVPVLDATQIEHALRHGAIHGALGTRRVGEAMILVAPHNPIPLLNEIAQRPETFELTYLKEGPDNWHIQFTRTA